jgi:hypothetical protein
MKERNKGNGRRKNKMKGRLVVILVKKPHCVAYTLSDYSCYLLLAT